LASPFYHKIKNLKYAALLYVRVYTARLSLKGTVSRKKMVSFRVWDASLGPN
jgi:hypothetical protein